MSTGQIYKSLVIRDAMIVNGKGVPPYGPCDIVVEDGKIKEIVNVDTISLTRYGIKRPTAEHIIEAKGKVQDLLSKASRHQVRQLAHGVGTAASFAVEMDIYEQFSRIYYHVKRIAKVVFPATPGRLPKTARKGGKNHRGGKKAA